MEKNGEDRRPFWVPLPSPYSKALVRLHLALQWSSKEVIFTWWWCVSFGAPPLIFIEGDQGYFGRGLEWTHLEPPLWANERLPHRRPKVGCADVWSADWGGRWTGFWPRTGTVLAESLLGGPWGRLCMIPSCPRSVTCSGGPSNPCERAWLDDAICIGLRSVFSLLLRCVFYLISPAYKYLPTLVKMVNNKSLQLCWCSYFMCLCRNLWRKIDT